MSVDTNASPRRPDTLGVHSLDRFVFSVPDIGIAERFYRAFGLDVQRDGKRLDLRAAESTHCWGSVFETGSRKKLEYLTFSAYDEDFERLAMRMRQAGACEPHPLSDGRGAWTRDADGTPVQLVVGAKVSPRAPSRAAEALPVREGNGAAPSRSAASPVRPRRLSHVLLFTRDVQRQIDFYTRTLGLRLSDRSGDVIAFLHGPHASDHHVIAFAKSHAPGLHHSSWDVASVDEVGFGAETMRGHGHAKGWGVGRHVLGSNYFHYVQDPWGSFAEYSHGIDFVAADVEWSVGDHLPEDSFYVWGPPVPDDFVVNHEAPKP
ncbi:MAG TPA: VOC family protein [Casimicrobiaceae bacterium]|nr:VOC family protein [Casimicrobiaceae bacterium]